MISLSVSVAPVTTITLLCLVVPIVNKSQRSAMRRDATQCSATQCSAMLHYASPHHSRRRSQTENQRDAAQRAAIRRDAMQRSSTVAVVHATQWLILSRANECRRSDSRVSQMGPHNNDNMLLCRSASEVGSGAFDMVYPSASNFQPHGNNELSTKLW